MALLFSLAHVTPPITIARKSEMRFSVEGSTAYQLNRKLFVRSPACSILILCTYAR